MPLTRVPADLSADGIRSYYLDRRCAPHFYALLPALEVSPLSSLRFLVVALLELCSSRNREPTMLPLPAAASRRC